MEKIKALIQRVVDTNFDCGEYNIEDVRNCELYSDRLEASRIAQSELIEEIEKLAKGLRAVESLIGESKGVAGYHKNGDIATWEELRTGGRCDALTEFDEALRALE